MHAGRTHATYEVRGRLTGDARDRGENDVDDCAARIARFLGIPQVIAPAAGPFGILFGIARPCATTRFCDGCIGFFAF